VASFSLSQGRVKDGADKGVCGMLCTALVGTCVMLCQACFGAQVTRIFLAYYRASKEGDIAVAIGLVPL
jgi:hypothetical protein